MAEHIADLGTFVVESPTSYHAAATIVRRLRAVGFSQLDEKTRWKSASGKKFIQRHGAVVAWVAPEKFTSTTAAKIVGTHNDSPAFKVKPGQLLTSSDWMQVGVEVYGGPLINSWLDRDLGIAGRLLTKDGETHLVKTGPICRIPQLAIHLDRTQNDNLHLDKQQHLQPILATISRAGLMEHLADLAGVRREDLSAHDLYTFDTQHPEVIGLHGEFFASGRLDNLSSTHAALVAMEQTSPSDHIQVFAAFDHEEVGSATTSGAAGPILADVLTRIAAHYDLDQDESHAFLARSLCVSADAGHLVHPNFPGHHDPVNKPKPNAGPLVKINAQQRYATDAVGAAHWLGICERLDIPVQPFVSNNVVPCGSTIGPITATRIGITTVDVGIGLLSMHSVRELCGVQDPGYLSQACAGFWSE